MASHSNYVKWCWQNKIYFVPKPLDPFGNKVKIVMIKKGREYPGTETFGQKTKKEQTELYKKIDSLYKAVFEKNVNAIQCRDVE